LVLLRAAIPSSHRYIFSNYPFSNSKVGEDITSERLYEQQLDTKQQDLEKSLQTQNMLAHLCENVPILLGTVRIHMSEGKPRVESLWSNAECYRNKEISNLLHDIKWITRYLESQKRGKTIHWEDHFGRFGNQGNENFTLSDYKSTRGVVQVTYLVLRTTICL
jgi:hypothetical protein